MPVAKTKPFSLYLIPADRFSVRVDAFDPLVDFGDNDANYQKLIERLAKGGWIAGVAIAMPHTMAGFLTPLGKEKMELARAAFAEFAPEALRPKIPHLEKSHPDTFLRVLGLIHRLSAIAADLQPPPLDPAESSTLFMFMLIYGIKNTTSRPSL
jgi:hypothetical protein